MTRFIVLFVITPVCSHGLSQPTGFVFDRKDAQKEIEVGRWLYDQLVKEGRLSKNEAAVRRVQRLFSILLGALEDKRYPYQVVVVAHDQHGGSKMNAFALPGGYIAIYDDLVEFLKDDDALAMVLAHEIGHAHNRHAVRRAAKAETDALIAVLIGVLAGSASGGAAANDYLVRATLAYSRELETEADEFGVRLFLTAGFDAPDATIFFDEMAKLETRAQPEYLSTHPDPKRRADRIRKTVAQHVLSPTNEQSATNFDVSEVVGQLPKIACGPNDSFPLAPGMAWEYEVLSEGSKSAYRLECKSVIATGMASVFRMEMTISSDRVVTFQYLTTDSAVWRRNRIENPSSPWVLEFLTDGSGADADVTALKFRVDPEPVETTTTLGRYRTKVVNVIGEDGEVEIRLYFAEGIGLVKRENLKLGVIEVLTNFRRTGSRTRSCHPGGPIASTLSALGMKSCRSQSRTAKTARRSTFVWRRLGRQVRELAD